MKIYNHYLLRELLTTFVIVILSLELIIGGNVLARWLGRVAQGHYPVDVIVPFLFYSSTNLLTTVLPFAAMLATVLVLGRQQQSGELNAAFFVRCGHADICAILMRFAAPLAVFLFLMLMFVTPKMHYEHKLAKQEAKQRVDLSVVTAGQFIRANDNLVLFIENKKDYQLNHLFVAEQTDAGIDVETAARGEQKTAADHTRWLHLYNGTRFEGTANEDSFQVSTYAEHAVRLPSEAILLPLQEPDFKSLGQLLASSKKLDQAELHWRLSLVLSLIVAVLMAFVLVCRYRSGPYHAVIPAAIVYLVYINVLLILSSWVMRASVPVYVLWLGHLPFVVWIAWSLSWRSFCLTYWAQRT